MKFLKKMMALALVLALLAAGACKPAEQDASQPGATSGAVQPDGRVYAESAIDLTDLPNIQQLRAVSDGSLVGIGADYEKGEYFTFRLGDDGAISSRVIFAKSDPMTSLQYLTSLDVNGNAYSYEMDMSAFWGEPARELLGATDEAADATAEPEAPAEPDASAAPKEAASADMRANLAAAADAQTLPAPADPADPSSGDPTAPTPGSTRPVVRKYDNFGKEVASVTLPELKVLGQGDFAYPDVPQMFAVDDATNNIYVMTGMELIVYDMTTGEQKASMRDVGNAYGFTVAGNGLVATTGYDDSASNNVIRCFDPVSGEEKWSIFSGNIPDSLAYNPSDGKLYGVLGRKIVSFDESGTEATLLELTDFSVLSPFYWLRSSVVGKDGTVYCILDESSNRERYLDERERQIAQGEALLASSQNITREQFYESMNSSGVFDMSKSRMVRIALTDAANVPPVTEITVSVVWEDYTLRGLASAFHAANPGIRVKLKEMLPESDLYGADVDTDQLIQRANTEIITGKAADVLLLNGLPYDSYGEKNILEDLLPYMESDPDFNMEDYRTNVLDAFKQNGKLTALPTTFYVPVFLSKKGEFTQPEITSAEFFQKLFSLKKDQSLPQAYARDATRVFHELMYTNIPQFQDENGNIMLDSPEFIGFLDDIKKADDIYKSLPPLDEDDMFGSRAKAAAMELMPDSEEFVMEFDGIYSYYAAQQWKQSYGKDFEMRFVPSFRTPNVKGFSCYNVYGMNRSSKQKDAAWQFLKFIISEQMQASDNFGSGLPVNKKAGEKIASLQLREADLERRSMLLDQRISEVIPLEGEGEGEAEKERNSYMEDYIANLFTQEDADKIDAIASQVDTLLSSDDKTLELANEEIEPFLKGQKNAADTAKTLQSRLSMYISEQG